MIRMPFTSLASHPSHGGHQKPCLCTPTPVCQTHLSHRHSDLSAMPWLWPLSPQALLWRGALGMSKHALCGMVASTLCRNGSSHTLSERAVKVLLKADTLVPWHNSSKYCLWNTDLGLYCLDQTVSKMNSGVLEARSLL